MPLGAGVPGEVEHGLAVLLKRLPRQDFGE